MKKAYFIAFTLLLPTCVSTCGWAQVVLSRQVIGSSGSITQTSQTLYSSTVGESIVGTAPNNGFTLTQGYQQPNSLTDIRFDLKTKVSSCATSTDGVAKVSQISGCYPPYTITWSNGQTGETVSRLAPGGYTVTISTTTCSVTREFVILTDPAGDCFLTFFTAFSPNGDGVNDVWKVENIFRTEFQNNHFDIFNRWGNLVWSGDGYDNGNVVWNGESLSGSPLPDGTYFFVANVADVIHKGYIDLTR